MTHAALAGLAHWPPRRPAARLVCMTALALCAGLGQAQGTPPAGNAVWASQLVGTTPQGSTALAALLDPRSCPAQPRVPAATDPVSLENALLAAVCRSARQSQTQGLTLQAQAAIDRARALLWPQLSASGRYSQSRGSEPISEAGLRLDWVLYDFGGASATQRAAREAWLAVLRERDADILLALAQASDAYMAALAAFGRMGAAAQNQQAAQESMAVASARHSAGAANVSDKLQAETAAGQARVDVGRARTQWRLARAELAAAMGLPIQTELLLAPIDVAEGLFSDRELDIEALSTEARERHPSVMAARARRTQSDAEAAAVRAQRWGSLNLSARLSSARDGLDTSTSNGSATALQWQLPLGDGGAQRSRELAARGQTLLRDAALEDSLSGVALQVWQAGQTLEGERLSVQASKLVLDTAAEALRASTERYRLGVGSFADVNSAFNSAAASRLQWVESRVNVLRAHVRLAAASGRFGGW